MTPPLRAADVDDLLADLDARPAPVRLHDTSRGRVIPFRVARGEDVRAAEARLLEEWVVLGAILRRCEGATNGGARLKRLRELANEVAVAAARDAFVNGAVFHGADPAEAARFFSSAYDATPARREPGL